MGGPCLAAPFEEERDAFLFGLVARFLFNCPEAGASSKSSSSDRVEGDEMPVDTRPNRRVVVLDPVVAGASVWMPGSSAGSVQAAAVPLVRRRADFLAVDMLVEVAEQCPPRRVK